MAEKKLFTEFRAGAVRSLANARSVSELAGRLTDPFARCSFRGGFSNALNLGAYYREGYEQAQLMRQDANEFQAGPVLPHAHVMCAMSLVGLREYAAAHAELDSALRSRFAVTMSMRCSRSSLCACARSYKKVVQTKPVLCELPELEHAIRSNRAEVLASRGLALATVGRLGEASIMAADASHESNAVESRVLVSAIDAVCAIKRRDRTMRETVKRLVDTAFESAGSDLLVSAYRGNPELLDALLSSAATREQAWHVAVRAGDEALVRGSRLRSGLGGRSGG